MNILAMNWQCIKNPVGGGAEVHFHEIFKRIVALGHKVTLLACLYDGAQNEEIVDGIRILRRGKRDTFNFIVKSFYKEIASQEKFDIVIDDINKIPFYTPIYVKEPLLAISHHFFGTSIYREANFIAGTYVVFAEWLMNFVYKKTPFVVVSQSTLSEFKHKGFDVTNFSIIYNALDHSFFDFKLTPKTKEPTITYFGRLKKYKSVDHLFYAFANVLKKYPSATLKIMGKGDFRPTLEALSKQLNIENSVNFLGFVSDEDKSTELSNSYCVVNTSMKEGWGITNIEANACGTLVISADSPGLRDSVKNGVSGLLYEYGNITELTNCILKILDDENYRVQLSENAVKWAQSFDWDTSAQQMLAKCEEVIQTKTYNRTR